MKFFTAVCALLVGSSAAFVPSSPSASNTALNLAVGETAPDFALTDQNGKVVKRSSIKKPLVVYFYPADATPVSYFILLLCVFLQDFQLHFLRSHFSLTRQQNTGMHCPSKKF